jgi:hypothetical protein
VLRTYPVHSESKFLNGARTRRGATRRRHVLADLVWNIGKEGDRFEEDGSLGAEDDPAVPYGLTPSHRAAAIDAVREAKARFGVRAFRKAAGVSDNTIKRALEPGSTIADRDLIRMRNGAARLLVADGARAKEDAALLAGMQARAREIGVTALAAKLEVDASNLTKVLAGARPIPRSMRRA